VETRVENVVPAIPNPCPVLAARNGGRPKGFVSRANSMLTMKERRPAFRTAEGWATSVLIEVGAIRECGEHGWMRDGADPHARVRALELAREHPPVGIS
jgi:hypothetical protein